MAHRSRELPVIKMWEPLLEPVFQYYSTCESWCDVISGHPPNIVFTWLQIEAKQMQLEATSALLPTSRSCSRISFESLEASMALRMPLEVDSASLWVCKCSIQLHPEAGCSGRGCGLGQ